MNPMDWTAGPFLTFYMTVAASVFLLLRWRRGRVEPERLGQGLAGLNVFHLAYLVGGHKNAMDTALVSLFEAGAIIFDERRETVMVDHSAALTRELQDYRNVIPGEANRRDFHAASATHGESLRSDLIRHGFIMTDGAVGRFRVYAVVCLAVPLTLGADRIMIGLHRHHPVGILTFLMAATALLGAWMMLKTPWRTKAGSAALARVWALAARAARAPLEEEMLLAFALNGSAVLAGKSYQSLFEAKTGGGGGGGGGCGGGGCGGGGCGG